MTPREQSSSTTPTKRDHRQEVTDSIVKMLEEGVAPWQKPWESAGMPFNPTTDKAYRGGNAVHLMATGLSQGYEDPRWMTYKQAAENGWQVRKGEKGTHIEFWEVKAKPEERNGEPSKNGSDESTKENQRRLIHRVYTVFNAKQIEGVPAFERRQPTEFEAVQGGERILVNSGASIAHDQRDSAFYRPSTDSIHLPPKEAFKDAPGYYGTALHELAHNADSGIMPRGFPIRLSTSRKRDHLIGIILTRRVAKIAEGSIVASSQSTEGALPMNTTNPLGTYPKQFREQLERQFYTPATVTLYDRCLSALNTKMEEIGIGLKDLDEEAAVNLIAKSGLPSRNAKHNRFMVRGFVRFLVGEGVAKPTPEAVPADTELGRLKSAYEDYLRRQRGLSDRTIFHSWRIAHRFLTFRFGEQLGVLAEITAADIAAFLQHVMTRTPPLRDKTLSSHLRNFFRYLFQAGKTATNLATGILSVAQRYGARLPRHLTSDEVGTLLKAIQADSSSGRRNYAMVLLIARLGLRAPEVIAIQIDDIDWRAGEILIRGKGKRHDRVPLPPDVGEALTDYIKQDRTTASRTLFVTGRPPHLPFTDGQVLNNILRSAFAKTGLKPPAPYVGSHILRHSLATNLVKLGAPLEEIGDMLRHRSRASTMIYAKLDVDGLRSIAQPWPVAGGAL